jgi:hypothetical protein
MLGAVGEWSPQEKPSHKKTSQAETLKRKERWHTFRLFGMNSLKEGAMWWIWSMCGWAMAWWTPSSFSTCQQYMSIVAMQRLDEHPAICTSNGMRNVYSVLLGNNQQANGLPGWQSCDTPMGVWRTVDLFPSHPRMDRCYTMHARWHNTTGVTTWYPVWRNSRDCVSCDACLCHGYITRFPSTVIKLAVRDSHRESVVEEELEVGLWRLDMWFEDFMCAIVQWYQEFVCSTD